MTVGALMSPADAVRPVAAMFEYDAACRIAVREDRSFDGEWWSLGEILIELNELIDSDDQAEQGSRTVAALTSGAFQWRLPSLEDAACDLSKCLDDGKDKKLRDNVKFRDNVNRALDDVSSIAVRAGLLYPAIDAAAFEEMPFRHATTVVFDTTGVLQGALDFVSRNLHPARVIVPSIVHMELVELSHRFFSLRRSSKLNPGRRVNMLREHIKSQGGQHALMNLELRSDIEVERTWLFGDPLRSAFRSERNSSLSDLNISVPVKSYVDRLILEDARRRQAQAAPNHVVRLLTGDQGFARMALVEGVKPIYFLKTRATDVFGSRLTGRTFHPFSGDVQRTSLVSILWELAIAFGSARLENDRGDVFRIVALGEGTSWSLYHSFDDLLWCEYAPAGRTKGTAQKPSGGPPGRGDARRSLELRPGASSPGEGISFGRFSVDRMFRLICALDDSQTMTDDDVLNILGARSGRGGKEYERFLSSANLISVARGTWRAETGLGPLSAALRNRRTDDVRDALKRAPSFSAFAARMRELDIGRALDPAGSGPGYGTRSAATYRTLGEITLLCASAFGEGPFPTPAVPDTEAFAEIALRRFSELDDGGGLVTVGAWLETVIRDDGIHPEVARRKLETANDKGLLRMSTEGSTPELRYDNRVVHVLRASAGEPVVERVRLYRGDYLIPGKASVSLRIEGAGR